MLYRYLVLLFVFSFTLVTSNSTFVTHPTLEHSRQIRATSGDKRSSKTQAVQNKAATQEELILMSIVNHEDLDVMGGENTTPLSTAGCSKCVAREEVKKYTLQHIQEDIMSKLGFSHPPNITGHNLSVKASLYDLISKHRESPFNHMYPNLTHYHGMQSDEPSFSSSVFISEEDEEFNFLTDRVLTISEPHPRLRHHPRGPHVLQFKFSPKTLEHKVQGAILWVYLRSTGTNHNVPVTIEVRKVSRPLSSNSEKPHTTVITTQKEIRKNGTEGEWVRIDVKRLVAEWFRNPKENHGLVLETNPSSEHGSIVTLSSSSNDDLLVPFLEVQTKDLKKRRTRRMAGLTCTDESDEPRCCKYPLKVDFEAFGWDWIIAPKFYEANYCSGECALMFLPRYPHTQLVRYSNTSVAGPCCAPRKMSHISMLYFDNDLNIIFGYLPNMVVDRCGCA